MFLTNCVNTTNKFMIYDEIDMMYNPITCELNLPIDEERLLYIDKIYNLTKTLYNNIFINYIF